MLTVYQIKKDTKAYKNTHPTNIYNNPNIRLSAPKIEEFRDEEGNIYKEVSYTATDTSKSAPVPARSAKKGGSKAKRGRPPKSGGSSKVRHVTLRVWPVEGKNYSDNSYIHVKCDCEFFKYYCDEAMWRNWSSWKIEDGVPKDEPYMADPAKNNNITNPNLNFWVCKHISKGLVANYHKRKPKRVKKIKEKPVLLPGMFF